MPPIAASGISPNHARRTSRGGCRGPSTVIACTAQSATNPLVKGTNVLIGVPRFELGTSPTRTERATRLRHTPSRPSIAQAPVRQCRRRSPVPCVRGCGTADHAGRRPWRGRTEHDGARLGRRARRRRLRRRLPARPASATASSSSCCPTSRVLGTQPIAAVVLTHGHDDHIAALAHLIRQGAPIGRIIGMPFTIELVRAKLAERRAAAAARRRAAPARPSPPAPSRSSTCASPTRFPTPPPSPSRRRSAWS